MGKKAEGEEQKTGNDRRKLQKRNNKSEKSR
jgi:hypothetical protein